jgi:hypothetical protein
MSILKTYDIIQKAVEEGLEFGWNRAHKHEDLPSKEVIMSYLIKDIMNSLDEIIDFNKINNNK